MPAGPALSRRTTLALAAGVVALAGCDDGDGGPDSAPTGSPGSADPDVALVDGVLAELARAQRVASSAGDTDLVALHGAHIEALNGTPAPTPARGRFGAADVQQRERRLQSHLVAAAVDAQSGALAALLASMSAAVSQRLASR
ncbi:hypothetical protein [Nocardioides sp. T2.26MG-1]|uniref:hypothetical protein n=1 Tax=Nocardioides sp. T2.26MG-1 TaxID=3041166 RepID=UPI002477AA2A|nr:hypothetical protein [Nocardioides sp. T2.26MG-1]CAI9419484.1 hypothetical protein HIDPHFAB_03715 [Nocardioides sp. T2.26MG-1]